MKPSAKNFLEIYFEAIDENIEEVVGELKDAGIDTEESQDKILQMIKKKQTEIKIENGKRRQARVIELIKKKDEIVIPGTLDEHIALAARKLGELDEEDIRQIKKDADLLKDIGKLIDGDADDTGKTSR